MCCKEYRFKTVIGFKKMLLDEVLKICRDTYNIDDTFRYKIVESWFPKYDYILIIYSKDRDQAFKRGIWIVKKALKDHGLLFWVKEKKGL